MCALHRSSLHVRRSLNGPHPTIGHRCLSIYPVITKHIHPARALSFAPCAIDLLRSQVQKLIMALSLTLVSIPNQVAWSRSHYNSSGLLAIPLTTHSSCMFSEHTATTVQILQVRYAFRGFRHDYILSHSLIICSGRWTEEYLLPQFVYRSYRHTNIVSLEEIYFACFYWFVDILFTPYTCSLSLFFDRCTRISILCEVLRSTPALSHED